MGDNALTLSCRKGHFDVAKVIIDHKADVNVKGKTDKTPLELALAHGAPSEFIARLCLARAAGVKAFLMASKPEEYLFVWLMKPSWQKKTAAYVFDKHCKSADQILEVEEGVRMVGQSLSKSLHFSDPETFAADARVWLLELNLEKEGYLSKAEWTQLARLSGAHALARVMSKTKGG